jgi:hypothetical protein
MVSEGTPISLTGQSKQTCRSGDQLSFRIDHKQKSWSEREEQKKLERSWIVAQLAVSDQPKQEQPTTLVETCCALPLHIERVMSIAKKTSTLPTVHYVLIIAGIEIVAIEKRSILRSEI